MMSHFSLDDIPIVDYAVSLFKYNSIDFFALGGEEAEENEEEDKQENEDDGDAEEEAYEEDDDEI